MPVFEYLLSSDSNWYEVESTAQYTKVFPT